MKNFIEHTNGLEYQFENDVFLNVFKRDSDVCYRLKTPILDVTRTIHPILVKHFKPINMRDASTELDKLSTIMR